MIELICKFKCGNHKLPVVKGRYNNINLEDRSCPLYNTGDIGDEIHYLFRYSLYTSSGNQYITRYCRTNIKVKEN